MEVPEDKAFIEVMVYHRNTRFDDRVFEAGYVVLKKATEDKPGDCGYKGGVSSTWAFPT